MGIRTIIKSFLGAFLFIIATSCDDDVSSIGESIQPESDKIFLGVDTLKSITVETVKLDAIHAKSVKGVLGKYTDPIFGRIESDYMCEVFPTKTAVFVNEIDDVKVKNLTIDSVFLWISVEKAIGDTISPAGLSVYQLNKELKKDVYTNVDPSEFCNMDTILGRGAFAISEMPYMDAYRVVTVPLKKELGEKFYKLWQKDEKIFDKADNLRPYFPGMYVTHTFGSDVLMTVNNTSLVVYYSFDGPTHDKSSNDSTYVRAFKTGPSPEVIQINSIENENLDDLITTTESPISYLKSPAGVYSKFNIPLGDLAKIVGQDTIINIAKMNVYGNTVKEQFSKFDRPDNLLFINKDSVENFFSRKNNSPDNVTSFVIMRDGTFNLYNFYEKISPSIGASTTYTNGFAGMFNYYLNKFREDGVEFKDLEYLLIPVDVTLAEGTNSSGENVKVVNSVTHSMAPTSAILKTEDIKIPLVFSKYNERKVKK